MNKTFDRSFLEKRVKCSNCLRYGFENITKYMYETIYLKHKYMYENITITITGSKIELHTIYSLKSLSLPYIILPGIIKNKVIIDPLTLYCMKFYHSQN